MKGKQTMITAADVVARVLATRRLIIGKGELADQDDAPQPVPHPADRTDYSNPIETAWKSTFPLRKRPRTIRLLKSANQVVKRVAVGAKLKFVISGPETKYQPTPADFVDCVRHLGQPKARRRAGSRQAARQRNLGRYDASRRGTTFPPTGSSPTIRRSSASSATSAAIFCFRCRETL